MRPSNRATTSLKKPVVAVALLTLFGSAVFADEPRTVEASVLLDASPEEAVDSFLDPGSLAGWWQVSRSHVDPRIGGVWAITWDDWGTEKTHHAWTGIIRELSATRLVIDPLVMDEPNRPLFAPLTLDVSAEAEGSGSRLTVRHGGYRSGSDWDFIHDAVVVGWEHVLGDLKAWLGDGNGAVK